MGNWYKDVIEYSNGNNSDLLFIIIYYIIFRNVEWISLTVDRIHSVNILVLIFTLGIIRNAFKNTFSSQGE